VETIRIVAEDRFIAVKFTPDLMAGFDLPWFEKRLSKSIERPTTLRDLLRPLVGVNVRPGGYHWLVLGDR
jgi:hypothetical protein